MSRTSSMYSVSLYKQIIDWVINCIETGQLKPGDKLPTEKKLAENFSVSRGTARTALTMLRKNRVVDAVQGSGYYVSSLQNAFNEERPMSDMAERVNALVADLKEQGCSDEIIANLFNAAIEQYTGSEKNIKLTVVECNPDILPAFKRQLASIPFVSIDSFILHDATTYADLDILETSDLITTTPNHFKQLLTLRPQLLDKVLKYNVSITPRTLSALSKIRNDAVIGLICESTRYYELVNEAIDNIFLGGMPLRVCYNCFDCANISDFLAGISCLILPYGSPLLENKALEATMAAFRDRDGQVIEFDYQVEQGSIAYLKEMVDSFRKSGQSI